MQTEHAEHKRDLRLRKLILRLLHAARTRPDNGWADGQFILDMVEEVVPPGQRFESDEHCLGLIRDLVSAGYAEQRDHRTRITQRLRLDWTSYRITARGTALVEEQIEPDPLVADERIRQPRPS